MKPVTEVLDYLDSLGDLTEYDRKLVRAIRYSITSNNPLSVYRYVCTEGIPYEQDISRSATICQEAARRLYAAISGYLLYSEVSEYIFVWDALFGCARIYRLMSNTGGQEDD